MNLTPEVRPSARNILLRSLLVGAAYAVVHVVGGAILGPLFRQPLDLTNGLLWWFTSTLLCLALAPFILNSTWSRRDTTLAIWAAIALVRSLGTGIEGSLFRPAQANLIVVGVIIDLGLSLLLAWLAVALIMPSQHQPPTRADAQRSLWGWIWRVLLVGLAYLVFYFVFGAANALLYTLSFYKNNPQYGLSLPPTGTIFLAQLVRGPLFGLGALFLLRASAMPERLGAVWLGLLLFILGGFGPYVETTFRLMPLGFSLATLAELFLQNFSTGLVAASLYKSGTRATG